MATAGLVILSSLQLFTTLVIPKSQALRNTRWHGHIHLPPSLRKGRADLPHCPNVGRSVCRLGSFCTLSAHDKILSVCTISLTPRAREWDSGTGECPLLTQSSLSKPCSDNSGCLKNPGVGYGGCFSLTTAVNYDYVMKVSYTLGGALIFASCREFTFGTLVRV